MKVDEDKLDLSFVISLVRATSILWQASVPLGISRLLLSYLLSLISLSMCFVSLFTVFCVSVLNLLCLCLNVCVVL
ncbi:hypothetical protein F2Q68_00007035 [Brassica cretica]|uniref:Uncharacterized protein n=1 Tax=Brassica cretica TaxID=69181 RepID=A0A8S9L2C8_BRACR|nr:hypothetical protein F2Q68_00007035 [Brassica cretica]